MKLARTLYGTNTEEKGQRLPRTLQQFCVKYWVGTVMIITHVSYSYDL